MLELHTCPMVEDPQSGRRRPLMEPTGEPCVRVGWCNVVIVQIAGETYRLVACKP
jgi:hypothetical protein